MSEALSTWEHLAVSSIHAARHGDNLSACRLVVELLDTHPERIRDVVRVWTASTGLAETLPTGLPVELRWLDEQDQPLPVEEIHPARRWAGRVMAAHLAGDETQIDALLASLPAERLPEHLGTLLSWTAHQMFRAGLAWGYAG